MSDHTASRPAATQGLGIPRRRPAHRLRFLGSVLFVGLVLIVASAVPVMAWILLSTAAAIAAVLGIEWAFERSGGGQVRGFTH